VARNDDGFTLIELLFVIIIIGILAGIAIPVYLGQRAKGYDAAAKNDLRNMAAFEEIYLNDYDVYGNAADIQTREPKMSISPGVTVTVVHLQGNTGYCLSGKHIASSKTWYYDSLGGGLMPLDSPGCSSVTSGASGGSLSG
jgi:type IV pilus assembly protein PilA